MSKFASTMICTIHQLEFSHGNSKEDVLPLCPLCGWKERNELRQALTEVTAHRDALLKAIEIKQLLTPKSEQPDQKSK